MSENITEWMEQNEFSQDMKSKITQHSIDLEILKSATEEDLRNISQEMNYSSISTLRLIKAVKKLKDAKINNPLPFILNEKENKLFNCVKLEIQNINKLNNNNNKIINEIQSNYSKTRNEIINVFNNIINKINNRKNVLLTKLENIKNNKVNNLNNQIKEANKYLENIKKCSNKQKEILQNNLLTLEQREKELENLTNNYINKNFSNLSCENNGLLFDDNRNENDKLTIEKLIAYVKVYGFIDDCRGPNKVEISKLSIVDRNKIKVEFNKPESKEENDLPIEYNIDYKIKDDKTNNNWKTKVYNISNNTNTNTYNYTIDDNLLHNTNYSIRIKGKNKFTYSDYSITKTIKTNYPEKLSLSIHSDSGEWTPSHKSSNLLIEGTNNAYSTPADHKLDHWIIFKSQQMFTVLTKVQIRNIDGNFIHGVKSFKIETTDNTNNNNWILYSLNSKFHRNNKQLQTANVICQNNVNKKSKFIKITFTENHSSTVGNLIYFYQFNAIGY